MEQGLEQKVARLSRHAGPAVTRFAEYLAGDFARTAERTALTAGFSTKEARAIARTATAGAMQSFASAAKQALFERRIIGSK